jgi:lipopolysaccharide biosynthesis glycosyltransferase
MIKLFVGFDQKEAIAYHVFCQSVLSNTKTPVQITPLNIDMPQKDGSNNFIYSRFLVPMLCNYEGWAIFADGDMVMQDDIAQLWALKDEQYAVQVVKHDYQTKHPVKYLGKKNEDYTRKNWSSLMLINCGHKAMRETLTQENVEALTGSFLHRFGWLYDYEIGSLPIEWNWLVMEYEPNPDAKLLHYTIGTPCFKQYVGCDTASNWKKYYHELLEGLGK